MTFLRLLIPCALVAACSGKAESVDPSLDVPLDTDREGPLSCSEILNSDPWEFVVGPDVYEHFPDLYGCDSVCDRSGKEVVYLESCQGPTTRTSDHGLSLRVYTCTGVRSFGEACD